MSLYTTNDVHPSLDLLADIADDENLVDMDSVTSSSSCFDEDDCRPFPLLSYLEVDSLPDLDLGDSFFNLQDVGDADQQGGDSCTAPSPAKQQAHQPTSNIKLEAGTNKVGGPLELVDVMVVPDVNVGHNPQQVNAKDKPSKSLRYNDWEPMDMMDSMACDQFNNNSLKDSILDLFPSLDPSMNDEDSIGGDFCSNLADPDEKIRHDCMWSGQCPSEEHQNSKSTSVSLTTIAHGGHCLTPSGYYMKSELNSNHHAVGAKANNNNSLSLDRAISIESFDANLRYLETPFESESSDVEESNDLEMTSNGFTGQAVPMSNLRNPYFADHSYVAKKTGHHTDPLGEYMLTPHDSSDDESAAASQTRSLLTRPPVKRETIARSQPTVTISVGSKRYKVPLDIAAGTLKNRQLSARGRTQSKPGTETARLIGKAADGHKLSLLGDQQRPQQQTKFKFQLRLPAESGRQTQHTSLLDKSSGKRSILRQWRPVANIREAESFKKDEVKERLSSARDHHHLVATKENRLIDTGILSSDGRADKYQSHHHPQRSSCGVDPAAAGDNLLSLPDGVSSSAKASSSSVKCREVRDLHNSLERQRRGELRNAFDRLKATLPSLADVEKASKLLILTTAGEFCRDLTETEEGLRRERNAESSRNSSLRRRLNELRQVKRLNLSKQ